MNRFILLSFDKLIFLWQNVNFTVKTTDELAMQKWSIVQNYNQFHNNIKKN